MRAAIALAVLAAAPFTDGAAADPVAFVEDASANAPVKPFSHLREGDVVKLDADTADPVNSFVQPLTDASQQAFSTCRLTHM